MKDRITEFLLKENISPAEFADKIGVQRSSVSHVLNGRNYPGASFLQKMLSSYKSLNPRWLLLGEGMMIDSKYSGKEPSLFSFPSEETFVKNNSPAKNTMLNSVKGDSLSEVKEENIETKPSKKTTVETKPEFEEITENIAGNKEIERIVLFYKDKTFSVYTPSR